MQSLVHQTSAVNNIPYETFVSRIKKFRTWDLLRSCNLASKWLDERKMQDAWLAVPPSKRYFNPSDAKIFLTDPALAFIAKTAIVHSSDMRQSTIIDDDLRGLVFMHAHLLDPISSGRARTRSGHLRFVIQTAAEQFPYQSKINRLIPRYWLMLIEGNRTFPARPLDIEEVWGATWNISLEKFILVAFSYWAGTQAYTQVVREFPSRGVLASKISPEECESVLAIAGADYAGFRESCALVRVDDPIYAKYELNPLVRTPLIIRDTEVTAPIHKLLPHRITEGVVDPAPLSRTVCFLDDHAASAAAVNRRS